MNPKNIVQFIALIFVINGGMQAINSAYNQNKFFNNKNQYFLSTNYSQDAEIIEAIKNKTNIINFQFYNVQDWTNLDEINKKVLPILTQKLDSDGLNLNDIDLRYDISKINIISTEGIINDKLKIKIKYNESDIFELLLNLDNKITDNSIVKAIKYWFDSSNNEKIPLFAWTKNNNEISVAAEKWIKEQLLDKDTKIKINDEEQIIAIDELDFFGLNTNQLVNEKFKLLFTYGVSEIEDLIVTIKISVTEEQILMAIKDKAISNWVLNLGSEYNYDNFIEIFEFERRIEIIRETVGASVIVNNEEIFIDPNRIIFQEGYKQKIKSELNPWSESVNIPIVYEPLGKEYYFNINFKFIIDYDIIADAFKNQINKIIIDGINFINIKNDKNQIKLEILQQIKKQFENGIIIKGKNYDLDLNELSINDFKILYNDKFEIKLDIDFKKISLEQFSLTLDLKNYYTESIFNEVQNIIDNNQLEVNEYNWLHHKEQAKSEILDRIYQLIKQKNNDRLAEWFENEVDNKQTEIDATENTLKLKLYNDFEKTFKLQLKLIPFNELDVIIPIQELISKTINDKLFTNDGLNIGDDLYIKHFLKIDFNSEEFIILQKLHVLIYSMMAKSFDSKLSTLIDTKNGSFTFELNLLKLIRYEHQNNELILFLTYDNFKTEFFIKLDLQKLTNDLVSDYLINNYFPNLNDLGLLKWKVDKFLYEDTLEARQKILDLILDQLDFPKILLGTNDSYLEMKRTDFTWNGYYEFDSKTNMMSFTISLNVFKTTIEVVMNVELL